MERKPDTQKEGVTRFAGFPDLFTAEHVECAEFTFLLVSADSAVPAVRGIGPTL
jgi:hypothetical protein